MTLRDRVSAFSLGRKASVVTVLGFPFEETHPDEVEEREQEKDRVPCQWNCAQPRIQSYC